MRSSKLFAQLAGGRSYLHDRRVVDAVVGEARDVRRQHRDPRLCDRFGEAHETLLIHAAVVDPVHEDHPHGAQPGLRRIAIRSCGPPLHGEGDGLALDGDRPPVTEPHRVSPSRDAKENTRGGRVIERRAGHEQGCDGHDHQGHPHEEPLARPRERELVLGLARAWANHLDSSTPSRQALRAPRSLTVAFHPPRSFARKRRRGCRSPRTVLLLRNTRHPARSTRRLLCSNRIRCRGE